MDVTAHTAARSAAVSAEAATTTIDIAAVQRRTLRLLFATQIISGVGSLSARPLARSSPLSLQA